VLPPEKFGKTWLKVLDTKEECISEDGISFRAAETINVQGRTVVLLKHKND